jgi:hypothetical protein
MSRYSHFRFSLIALAAAAGLALTACATSQKGFEPIAMTRDASVVASCEKVADIQARPGTFDDTDAETQLQREARQKGANTVLISDADAQAGVAYRCAMPSVAKPGGESH